MVSVRAGSRSSIAPTRPAYDHVPFVTRTRTRRASRGRLEVGRVIALVSSNRSVIRINPAAGHAARHAEGRGFEARRPFRFSSPIPLAEGTLGAVGKLWGCPESAGSRSGPLATSPRTSPNWFADWIDCGSYRPAALSRFVQSSSRDSSSSPLLLSRGGALGGRREDARVSPRGQAQAW